MHLHDHPRARLELLAGPGGVVGALGARHPEAQRVAEGAGVGPHAGPAEAGPAGAPVPAVLGPGPLRRLGADDEEDDVVHELALPRANPVALHEGVAGELGVEEEAAVVVVEPGVRGVGFGHRGGEVGGAGRGFPCGGGSALPLPQRGPGLGPAHQRLDGLRAQAALALHPRRGLAGRPGRHAALRHRRGDGRGHPHGPPGVVEREGRDAPLGVAPRAIGAEDRAHGAVVGGRAVGGAQEAP
ncbi:hypothetical protein Mterra_03937 [Calidithermus terrae]|uniref:Uncharacterized protein n=1 Tax=Calidithermus terrae TaxID=1408545 RepID=A0A399E0U8_9DEIN|nr:hypothetical protein Mterra_03937 [Calidithermus terrae]